MSFMEFFTIGVYNSTAEEFFGKLTSNRIDTFCDIRQRRGVRGAQYAFANSARLQAKLHDLDIRYEYVSGLATPDEIRELQYRADHENKQLKRERMTLAPEFIVEYKRKVLAKFDMDSFLAQLKANKAHRIALFCVEAIPEACHRSLVANKLNEKYKFKIIDL